MKKCLLSVLLVLSFAPLVYSGTYAGLKPGVSAKQDADRILGKPLREIIEGVRYEYKAQDLDIRLLAITLGRDTQLIEKIEIFSQEHYSKAQYLRWFGLGKPDIQRTGNDGNLVQYYIDKGIALYYAGPDDSHPITGLSHFNPLLLNTKPKAYYERAVFEAFYDQKDFERLKRIVDEGIELYPESPRLWTFRAKYHYFNVSESEPDRNHLALSAAEKALELDPADPKNHVNVGWIYQEGFKDFVSAIHHYEKGESFATLEPRLYFYMAKCYEAVGNLEKATRYFQRFLDILPQCTLAPEALQRLQRVAAER
jgi:tetratricopeptide (TPR) repeat protein